MEVSPPAPYSAPSIVSRDALAQLRRADNTPFVIVDASFGGAFSLVDTTPIQVDVPLDPEFSPLAISKTVSRTIAQPGDALVFTVIAENTDGFGLRRDVQIIDTADPALRFLLDTVRIDGQAATGAVTATPDGRQLIFALGDLAPGASRRITYAMTVQPDASPGYAENIAEARDAGGSARAGASVRIERSGIADRMTIIGQITAGPCHVTESRIGIPGVRVMMEDGSFAITDATGRYHFDGVVPGMHVVQAAPSTLPEGGEFIDCTRSSRSAGSTYSHFASGQGGSLVVVDFHAELPAGAMVLTNPEQAAEVARAAEAPEDPAQDWLALGDGPDGWLAPEVDSNPRAPAIRVAIRHRTDHSVSLTQNGSAVAAVLFEGTQVASDHSYAVSHWRGVPLRGSRESLGAQITAPDGSVVAELERDVFFTTIPARAELVPEQSHLVADGQTTPVIAVRILDAAGRPMREGVSGEVTLSAPYAVARPNEERQPIAPARGQNSASSWQVSTPDGIALIPLAPTMISGPAQLDFRFTNGEVERRQIVDTWIVPGDIGWTVIGLAEGSIGARSVADNMERSGQLGGQFDSDLGENARVALYVKGRVLGRYLMTIAYDSASQSEDQRALGTIDPDAYYTVFGDTSQRGFDAASREKLYVRIEAANFHAIYGDFETGFNEAQLTRYNRTATGAAVDARIGQVEVSGFVAEIRSRYRRDEIQGQGISGPYTLSARAIVPNSETITLEVRDRFRSEIILSSRVLEQYVDYDIDRLSGSITFSAPVLSRSDALDPQFIVAEYEVDGDFDGEINAGLRATWESADGALRVGAAAITDMDEDARTDLAGVDMRARIDDDTEIRAEIAASRSNGDTATAWLVEAEHRSGDIDARAYAQSVDSEFGTGQQNAGERGSRRIGADVRIAIDDSVFASISAWQSDSLDDVSRRRAGEASLTLALPSGEAEVGMARFEDRLADGSERTSTVANASVTQRFLDNRLEVSASTSIALDGASSLDLPARHRLALRYGLSDAVRLLASYEIADGENLSASTLRGGIELSAWPGALLRADLAQQDEATFGGRTIAGLGFAQTLQVTPSLAINGTIDSNWSLGSSFDVANVLDGAHPVASGGHLGSGGAQFEDFTAVTLGANWRRDLWNASARAEYRDGQFANRMGVNAGLIRQLGDGTSMGAGFTWTEATGTSGVSTSIFDSAIAAAYRPQDSGLALLGKLTYRSDRVGGAVSGDFDAVGRTALTVDGDAISRRFLATISADYTGLIDHPSAGRTYRSRRFQAGFFGGLRHNLDEIEALNLDTTFLLGGVDLRFPINDFIEIGGRGTLRTALDAGTISYAFGPTISIVPAENLLLILGYNFAGFSDPDFYAIRQTDSGFYISISAKLDADTLGILGLQP